MGGVGGRCILINLLIISDESGVRVTHHARTQSGVMNSMAINSMYTHTHTRTFFFYKNFIVDNYSPLLRLVKIGRNKFNVSN